jgi:hypothetical protein
MRLIFLLTLLNLSFSNLTLAKNNDEKLETANIFPVNIVQAITKFRNEINFLNSINNTSFDNSFGYNLNSNQLYESFFMNFGSHNNQSHNISQSCVKQLDYLITELKNKSMMAISGKNSNKFN